MVCTTCPGTLFPAQLEAFFPQQNGDNINRLCNKRREYAICPFVAVPLSSTEFPIAWTPFLIQVGLFQDPMVLWDMKALNACFVHVLALV